MAKAKPKTKLMVNNGAGGMLSVVDRRFERDWPIELTVPTVKAENWFRYLEFESERRSWSSAGLSQLEARENSGSQMLLAQGVEVICIAWERERGGSLKVRARPGSGFHLAEAEEFFRRVNDRSDAGTVDRRYWWGTLEYKGRAWRGELWLDDHLRIGPPSVQYNRATRGPRAVIVDAEVESISQGHSAHVFQQLKEELAAFLTVVTGTLFQQPRQDQVWTWALTERGTDCSVRTLGYVEAVNRPGMPARGLCQSVAFGPVEQFDNEFAMPNDIVDLWQKYRALAPERRRQFLASAAKIQEACLDWPDRITSCFASLVIACEALKPIDPLYDDHNVYQVIEALLGHQEAERLRTQLFDPKVHPKVHPQAIRSAHVHRGEFRGLEFAFDSRMSELRDPTFEEACRAMFRIAKAAMSEWLRRGGIVTLPPQEQKWTWRRWVRHNALAAIPICIALGVFLGWFLRLLFE